MKTNFFFYPLSTLCCILIGIFSFYPTVFSVSANSNTTISTKVFGDNEKFREDTEPVCSNVKHPAAPYFQHQQPFFYKGASGLTNSQVGFITYTFLDSVEMNELFAGCKHRNRCSGLTLTGTLYD